MSPRVGLDDSGEEKDHLRPPARIMLRPTLMKLCESGFKRLKTAMWQVPVNTVLKFQAPLRRVKSRSDRKQTPPQGLCSMH